MSDDIELRHVEADEIEAFEHAKAVTFLDDLSEVARFTPLRRRSWEPARIWGALADGRFVGTLRTMSRQLSLPGAYGATIDVTADALTSVTVSATHRRRGLMRRMLGDSLDAARERGDVLSILIAAEWAIYGRFGYWPAATWAGVTLHSARAGARMAVPTTGSLRQVDAREMRKLAPAVFEVARTQRAGQIDRRDIFWDLYVLPEWRRTGQREQIEIVHEGDDGVDGCLAWCPTRDFDQVKGGAIDVADLFATNQDAYTALWGYLLSLDVVEEIRVVARPPDEPLPYLLVDGRSARTTALFDAMWVRLLDVPAALSARRYAVPGRLCFDVIDDDIGGYTTGRYLLDAGPDGSECHPAPERTPQLRLSQRALAAVYLGQPSLRRQQVAGLVDELTPGAVHRADVMFATALQPWVATGF